MNRRGFLRLGLSALAGAAVAKHIPALAEAVQMAGSAGVGPVPVVYGARRHSGSIVYYAFDPSTGIYTFDAADAGTEFVITYDHAPEVAYTPRKAETHTGWSRPKRSDKLRHYS